MPPRSEMMLRYAARLGWSADVLMMDPAASSPEPIAPGYPSIRPSTLRHQASGEQRGPVRSSQAALDPPVRHRSTNTSDTFGYVTATRPRYLPSPLLDSVRSIERAFVAGDYYVRWHRWARRAAAMGIALAHERGYECIISSGPPHMAHEAARRIAVAISRPLVSDLRVPWTSDDLAPPDMSERAWRALSRRYERQCLDASAVSSPTPNRPPASSVHSILISRSV